VQFTFIISLITAFSALFSLIYVMTGGGPGYGTTTLEFYSYQQAFSAGDFSVGATAGVVTLRRGFRGQHAATAIAAEQGLT